MEFESSAFDALQAPAREDFASRAIRLAATAGILAPLAARAPSSGLAGNLSNPEMLRVWPLRDEVSQAGVEVLLNGYDPIGLIRADWLRLFGQTGHSSLLSQEDGDAESESMIADLYSEMDFQNLVWPELPSDSLAVETAFTGYLASMVTTAVRDGSDMEDLGAIMAAFAIDCFFPLAEQVVNKVEAEAQTACYRAFPLLMQGYLNEFASLVLDITGGIQD